MTALGTLTGKLTSRADLSRDEVAEGMRALLDEAVTEDSKAEFLTALARKGETAGEIAAFATELRARAVDPQIDPARFGGVVLDVVGTGADLSNTFNISTCTVFIAAAAGVAVAKHGNQAITSKCGAADVLTALGAKIELTPEAARRCLETAKVLKAAAGGAALAGQGGGVQAQHLGARREGAQVDRVDGLGRAGLGRSAAAPGSLSRTRPSRPMSGAARRAASTASSQPGAKAYSSCTRTTISPLAMGKAVSMPQCAISGSCASRAMAATSPRK